MNFFKKNTKKINMLVYTLTIEKFKMFGVKIQIS